MLTTLLARVLNKGDSVVPMPSRNNKTSPAPLRRGEGGPARAAGGEGPEWTQGLRQLYNSVVEEPLPDNFKELLAQLNKGA